VLGEGSKGNAVTEFQKRILVWDPDALPKWGADGDYGNETITAVKRFQEEQGLDATGNIDGVTAALLPASPADS
jgi:N-acetylmuramoyl-L-alanine amidase